ncbi:unnamed protein product [Ranitomeya imitator]|uniref:Uncharacterized protein n=1 Tax=Ranitomeya imitator TaxID=111125 RepID=A0ABN9MLL4_9NEOB|nr:unnamed protein product [Ranitomeya imitator]
MPRSLGNQGKHRVTKRRTALSNPMFTLVTSVKLKKKQTAHTYILVSVRSLAVCFPHSLTAGRKVKVKAQPLCSAFTLRPAVTVREADGKGPDGHQNAGDMPKCLVKGCQHSSGRKSSIPGVTLHPFPKDLAIIKKWLLQTNQDFGDLDLFAQGILQGQLGVSRICSVHFAPECYRLVGSEKLLLDGAIPTRFPDLDKPTTRTEAAVNPALQNLILPKGLWANNVSVASSMAPWGSDIKSSQANMAATNTMGIGKSSHPTKSRVNLPGIVLSSEMGALHTDTSSGKVHRAVQWPEYEHNVNGEAWKVLHDHYYRVPSGTKYQDINRYSLLTDYMSGYGIMSYSGESYWENELFSMLQCVASFVTVNRNNNIKTARILNQALDIISTLSEEEWVIVNKNSINKGLQELTGEFPVKCDDVAVYFTKDEWSYIDQHRADYQDFLTDNKPANHTWEVPEHWDSDTITMEEEEEVEEEERGGGGREEEDVEEFDEEEEEKEDLEIAKKRVDSSDWEPDSEVESESDVGSEGGKEDNKSLVKLEEQQLPHPCDQCKESFADAEALETHKVTHVEKCEDCKEVFNTKAKLIKHRAENHAVKRYACTICGIQYNYKSQFIIHKRAHTGEKTLRV